MALSTYAELKSAVADWLDRGDLAGRIPDFIALAEARLDRVLRLRRMETEQVLNLAAGARSVTLPAGFREALGLWRIAPEGRIALRFVTPGQLPVSTAAGRPDRWTIDGGSIAFERPGANAASYALRMLGRLSLSDAAPTNPALQDHPDLYLFATLMEAAPYLRDAELLQMFAARLEAALAEARAQEARRGSLARLSVEAPLAAEAS